jgi:hypothetical protein
MATRTQLTGAYLGFVFMVLFLLGFWVLAGFVPPPSPTDTPPEIAHFFAQNITGIRAGMLINMLGAALLLPWGAAVAVQLKRIEGRHCPLTYTQLMCGALLVFELILPCAIWETAAFRPHASAESIQRLNDLAWLPFLGILSTAVVQGVVIGAAILKDKRAAPVFPRWAGYFNIWIVMMFFPAAFIFLFKTGPFAWNGLLAWWLILVVFSLWILVDSVVLVGAVKRQAAEPDDPPADLDELAAEFARFRLEHARFVAASNGVAGPGAQAIADAGS